MAETSSSSISEDIVVSSELEEPRDTTQRTHQTSSGDGFATFHRPRTTYKPSPYGEELNKHAAGKQLPRVANLTARIQPSYVYAPGPADYVPARDRAGVADVGRYEANPRQGPATFFTTEASTLLPEPSQRAPPPRTAGFSSPGRYTPGKDSLCLHSPSWRGRSGVRTDGVAPAESYMESPPPTAYSRRTGTQLGTNKFGKTDVMYTAKERAFMDVASRYTVTDHMTMSQMQKGWPGGYGPDKLSHYPGSQHYLRDLNRLPTRMGRGNFGGYVGLYGGSQHSFGGRQGMAGPDTVRDPAWRGMLYPRFIDNAHLDEALGRESVGPARYDILRETQLGGPAVEGDLWWNAGRSVHAGHSIVNGKPVGLLDPPSVCAPKMPFSSPPKLGSEVRPGPATRNPTATRDGTKVNATASVAAAPRFGTDKQRWRAEEAAEVERCKAMPGGWHQPFLTEAHNLNENVGTFSPGPVYYSDCNTVNDQRCTQFTSMRKPRGFSFGTGERFNYGNGMSSGGMAIQGRCWAGEPAGATAKRTASKSETL